MNAETLDLLERPFGEIVDDLLTAVVGGVVNEPLLFDVRNLRYPLAEPARAIRAATGLFQKAHVQFQLDVDFSFSPADNALIWRDEGRKPDDESLFYVDYFRRFGESPLTDINVGSVTRTLNEAIAREVAFVYQQVKAVYISAFIDTAIGKSLDLVVSILGVTRKTKDFAEGLVTFFRDPSAGDGNIAIPEGTGLVTAKGEATFISTQLRNLQRGQARIDVPVRATEASKGPAGEVAAGLVNTLAVPITGISRVTNLDPTVLGEKDETDEELRARAKATVRSLGKATLAALKRVIAEQRATLVDVFEPNITGKESPLGTVTLFVNVKPARLPSLRNELEDTRAAGVLADLVAKRVFVTPRVSVTLQEGLPAAGSLKVLDRIVAALADYLDLLEPGAPATGKAMLKAIKAKGIDGLTEVQIKDVIVRRTNLQTLPQVTVEPARDLLRSEADPAVPVQDSDFDKIPTFQILTSADQSKDWFFVLDMDPTADIVPG
jgi:hypothetical protein